MLQELTSESGLVIKSKKYRLCKVVLTIIIAILPVITACSKTDTEVSVPEEETGKKTEIKFLQLNLWVECTKVEHAPEYLIEQIATLQPDIATFCELYKGPQDDP